MERQEFYNTYKERYNLDNINWDYPKNSTVKVNQHIFNVRVSLKSEIDRSILFYVCNGMIHSLDVDFFRKQMLDESDYELTGFKRIEKGKLIAIEVPYKYLKHDSLDWKDNSMVFNNDLEELPLEKVNSLFDDITASPDLEHFIGGFTNIDSKIKEDLFTPVPDTDNPLRLFLPNLDVYPSWKSEQTNITKTSPDKVEDIWDDEFQTFFENKIKDIKELVLVKSKEYVRNKNRLHNFETGAKFTGQTRETVLYGFLLKHLISLQDIVKDIELGKLPTKKLIGEKTLDIIIYNIILHYSIEDKINNGVS